MSGASSPTVSSNSDRAVTRGEGGLAPAMHIFTPDGPTRVDVLSVGDTVYALNPETRILKPKPITARERIVPQEPLVAIECRWATLYVGARHPVYYQTKAIDRPRVVPANNLTDRIYYKFLTGWQAPPGKRLASVDITDLTDTYQARVRCTAHGNAVRATLPDGCEPVRCNSHTGYYFDSSTFKRYQDTLESLAETVEICGGPNSWGRPYKFEAADFIRFLGWFITEGSVYWNSTKDTAEVKIAQKTEQYRQAIRSLFDRLGIDVCASPSGFTFSSTVYGELLERLCGATSQNRHLPWFVWELEPNQKRLLLDTLLAGDGNEFGTYYTASEQLAFDVMRLAMNLGITPRYSNRYGGWQVFINRTKDGFRSDKHVTRREPTESLVRLTVRDYPAVLAGTDGTFQWIGVSRIA